MVFLTFLNLSLNVAIRSSWSEPQSTANLVFADCIELLHLQLKEYNQSDFAIDQLVMSMCRVIPSVVEKGYLLWPVCSFDKTRIAFALLHFVLQDQTYLLLHIPLDFLLWHSKTLWWKGRFFGALVLIGFVSLVFIELFDFSFLGISGWSIYLDYCDQTWKQTKIILSFLRLHPSAALWTLSLTMRAIPFLLRDSCPQ